MKRKRNRFLLFLCSFVPGMGEMYLGFMKMGVSLMLGFAILTALVAIMEIGVFAIFPVVMYVYSFFHANHLGAMSDEDFANMPDRYFYGLGNDMEEIKGVLAGKKKAAAVVMIVIGVIMLWNVAFDWLFGMLGADNVFLREISYFVNNDLPRLIFAFAVIWIGLRLIRGGKVIDMEDMRNMEDAARVETVPDRAAQERHISGTEKEQEQTAPNDTAGE